MKLFKNRIISILLAVFLVISTVSLAGCSSNAKSATSNAMKIALICSAAGPNDNGYNQSAIDGLKKLKNDYGANYKVVESTDIPGSLTSLASAGYKLIFSLEYNFDALIKGVGGQKPIADQYPNTTFVVFNANPNVNAAGKPIHKNVISVMFNVNESSFLAGALSVLVNENADKLFDPSKYSFTPGNDGRKIGFIGGSKSNGITVFSYGYASGANYEAHKIGANYTVYTSYDAGFTDSAAGAAKANSFFSNGANVIFSSAGSVGDGVDSKAKDVKKLAIEVDANKDSSQPGHILTSVIKNTRVPVYALGKEYYNNTISKTGGKELDYNLKSDATGITDLKVIASYVNPSGKATWNNVLEEMKNVASKIDSGEIKIVNAQIGDTFDKNSLSNVSMPNE